MRPLLVLVCLLAVRFVLELCQVRSRAGAASKEMVLAFNKLRESYRASTDRDPNLDEVTQGMDVLQQRYSKENVIERV